MIPLLDVNLLLACTWASHERHVSANRWLKQTKRFATCSISQMGFLRVSMSTAYGADFADARSVLQAILNESGHQFASDETQAASLPELEGRHDVTDAHLVCIARSHGLLLATLDDSLCKKNWARGVAVNPLSSRA